VNALACSMRTEQGTSYKESKGTSLQAPRQHQLRRGDGAPAARLAPAKLATRCCCLQGVA
jgi:hypothetical protein